MVHQSSRTSVVLVASFGLSVVAAYAQTIVPGGVIQTDTTWSLAGSPYSLADNVLIASGATLTIEPGVQANFHPYALFISGELNAVGLSPAARIRLPGGSILFTAEASPTSILAEVDLSFLNLESGGSFPRIENCNLMRTVFNIFPCGSGPQSNVVIIGSSFDDSNSNLNCVNDLVLIGNEFVESALAASVEGRVQIEDNSFLGDPIRDDFDIATNCVKTYGGTIARNTFVGRFVTVCGFDGEWRNNSFSMRQVRSSIGTAAWLQNDFVFQFGTPENDAGLYLESLAAPVLLRDNNFTSVGGVGVRGGDQLLITADSTGLVINAENNWWGTSDQSEIENLITHFNDSINIPFVDFAPFRTEPVPLCTTDVDCADDSVFCNGPELCIDGLCESAGNPCQPPGLCNEGADVCDPCLSDVDCDNGVFCDGTESCGAGNVCQAGTPPCTDLVCDEVSDACVECLEDPDDDEICDGNDNCPTVANPSQSDADGNGVGDACEPCVSDANCDDRNECTIDSCGGTGLCEQTDKDDGIACEDGFFCTINDSCSGGVCASGPVNPLCVGPPGEGGSQGTPGSAGPSGPAGVSCWDLDGDGTGDIEEDINEDGDFNALDCVGEPGPPGISCWDLNGNGIGDLDEDANGDGDFDALDCQGATGRPCEDDSECQDGLFCNGTEQCDDDTCGPGALPCDVETETCLEDTNRCIPAEQPPGQTVPDGGNEPAAGLCGSMGSLAMILMFMGLAALWTLTLCQREGRGRAVIRRRRCNVTRN